MRTWISSGICILVSATVGFAIGVGTWASMAASFSPIAGKIHVTTGGFDSLFEGMARLGADETIASNCDGKGDLKFALDNEAQTIRVLQDSARTARLALSLELCTGAGHSGRVRRSSPSPLPWRSTKLLQASNIRRQTRPTQNKPFWIC